MSLQIPRQQYVNTYGPTVGDRIRLADTSLLIEVEKDYTTYGEEVKFGGAKPCEMAWVSLQPAHGSGEPWI